MRYYVTEEFNMDRKAKFGQHSLAHITKTKNIYIYKEETKTECGTAG